MRTMDKRSATTESLPPAKHSSRDSSRCARNASLVNEAAMNTNRYRSQPSRVVVGLMIVSLMASSCQQMNLTDLPLAAESDEPQALPAVERMTASDLAADLDSLERDIECYGSVAAEQPSVWGQARLTMYREEFEKTMQAQLNSFHATLQGSLSRSDQAYAADALALSYTAMAATGGSSSAARRAARASSSSSSVSSGASSAGGGGGSGRRKRWFRQWRYRRWRPGRWRCRKWRRQRRRSQSVGINGDVDHFPAHLTASTISSAIQHASRARWALPALRVQALAASASNRPSIWIR